MVLAPRAVAIERFAGDCAWSKIAIVRFAGASGLIRFSAGPDSPATDDVKNTPHT